MNALAMAVSIKLTETDLGLDTQGIYAFDIQRQWHLHMCL